MSTENAPGKNPTADATGSPADAPPVAELRSEAPVTPTRTDQQGRSIGGIGSVSVAGSTSSRTRSRSSCRTCSSAR